MKKSELRNIIKEEIKNILKEVKYRAKFSVEHGSGDTAKDWKNYIKDIPGVKVSIYPSAYQHHTAVDVTVDSKDIAKKVISKWRGYGIDWPELQDFEPIGQYSSLK